MRVLIFIGMCFGFAFCADVSLSSSDFVERLINFVIFFAILWYFGADKIKAIFRGRTQEIALSFEKAQEQTKAIEKEKEKAIQQLSDAESKASEIVALAKREAMIIAQQYREKVDRDIQSVSVSFDQVLAQEEREVLRDNIQKILKQSTQKIKIQEDADFYLKVLSRRIK